MTQQKVTRQKVPAPPEFTQQFGYSLATRAGNFIAVSSTAPRGADGRVVAQGDVYGQARQVLVNIRTLLESLGASLADVVRTRVYITDMAHLRDIGRAHLEFFGEIEPAVSLIEAERFFDPDVMVEMEVDAYVA